MHSVLETGFLTGTWSSSIRLGWVASKPQKPSYLYLLSNKIAVDAVISGLLCRYKSRTQILIVAFSLLTEQSSLSCSFVSSYLWKQDFTTENLFTFSLPFPFFTHRKVSASIHAMILLSMKSATEFKETFVMYQILDCDLVTWYWVRDVLFPKSFTNHSSDKLCKGQPICFDHDFYFLDYNYLIFSFPPFSFSHAPIYFLSPYSVS